MGRPQHTCFKPLQKGGRGAPCLLRGFEDHPPTPPAPHSPSVLTAQMISLSERPAHCTGFVMPLFVIIKQGKAASIQYGLKIWARDQVLVGNTTAISLPQPLELCVHSWNIITSSLQPSLDHWFSTSHVSLLTREVCQAFALLHADEDRTRASVAGWFSSPCRG